jgi:type I restriction enzyme S subunit
VNGEWKTVALDEIATIERDAIQPGAISQGTAYLGLEHIESGGKILGAKPVDEGELASSKFKFTERHLLYGKLRPYLAKIACPDFTGICSTDILPILPGPHLERRFLCHFLRQPSMVDYANSRAAGANLPRLSPSALAGFEIPLPPLAEQRRIAEVLDKAEALRAKRRATLAQLDSLTQSLFLDLFGDPATNPKKWPKASLNDCTEKIQIGPFGSLLHQEDYVADGIPLVNPKHIQGGAIATNHWESVTQRKYDQLETYHLRQGDIVMGRRGEMGRCAIVSGNEPLLCGTGSLIIRPDNERTSALFLCAILSTQQMKEAFERLSLGQTLPNLNSGIVGKFMLPLPPIALQREFARRVAAVEKLKTAQRAALAELDALFASLQHRAFRGELWKTSST